MLLGPLLLGFNVQQLAEARKRVRAAQQGSGERLHVDEIAAIGRGRLFALMRRVGVNVFLVGLLLLAPPGEANERGALRQMLHGDRRQVFLVGKSQAEAAAHAPARAGVTDRQSRTGQRAD